MADKDKCGVCNQSESEDRPNTTWIQCEIDTCLQWFHLKCLQLSRVPADHERWICAKCDGELHTHKSNNMGANDNGGNGNGPDENSPNESDNEGAAGADDSEVEIQSSDDETQLKMMMDLIKEKEKLCAMKEKQLELLTVLSEKKRYRKVNEWKAQSERSRPIESSSNIATTSRESNHPNVTIRQQRKTSGVVSTQKTGNADKCGDAVGNVNVNDISMLMKRQLQLMNQHYLQDLPEFDGSTDMWPIFYQQFITTTEQGGFDDAFNLIRLRKCLKGEARQAVIGILAMPNSLSDVLTILKKRFGSFDVIVKRKLKDLVNLVSPNENKPQTVRQFYEFLIGFNATLKNARAFNYLESPQTMDAILDKLPPHCTRKWLRAMRETEGRPTIESFLNWFEPYYDCAIACEKEMKEPESSSKRTRNRVNVNVEEPISNGRQTQPPPAQSSSTSVGGTQCRFCRKPNHTIVKCSSFQKLNCFKRWNFVRQQRLCFVCLMGKHRFENCDDDKTCGINDCDSHHHKLLHNHVDVKQVEREREHVLSTIIPSTECTNTHYRILPVKLQNLKNGKSVVTWAFLDEGSSPTMLATELAKKLELDGEADELCTVWTDNTIRKDKESKRVKLEICGINQQRKFTLHNVRTASQLHLPLPSPCAMLQQRFEHLRDLNIADIPIERPGILIGLEHAKLGLMYEIREGNWNEPVASRTRLGWVIHGKQVDRKKDDKTHFSCHVCECSANDDMNNLMRDFQSTEAFGVKAVDNLVESTDDIRARQILSNTTSKIDTQYETGLIWKQDNFYLPENRKMAEKRLLCLEQKLNRDDNLKQAVMSIMSEHISKGYLERITDDISKVRHWYLPVFSVQNPNKPSKVRIVFDAAAKCNNISLNDMLLKGPDMLVSLMGIILRFRQRQIAVSADIAEMFHRVKIIPSDQLCQLVLWRNCEESSPLNVYKMTRMTFGATCSPCSASYVLRVNAKKFENQYPRAVESIEKNHYVDDLLDSFDSEDEALKVSQQIHFIHGEGGFLIRNWISNSNMIADEMNRKVDRDEVFVNLNMSDESSTEKVLGMYWSTTNDQFVFKLNVKRVDISIIEKSRLPTKREMLKIMMSQFDPLGILSPIIVHAKIVMQYVWKSGIQWDEKIPDHLQENWFNWLESLEKIETLRVNRWYFKSNVVPIDKIILHLFADASEDAFAAIAFLQVCYSDSRHTSFVAAKSRVSPQKCLSIPRLELQAAVMATRLKETIVNELSIKMDEIVMWTDSQTVLSWIRSTTRRYSAFVSHRVSEILDATTMSQWRWVPSSENVADQATRVKDIPIITDVWLNGPRFLADPPECWPVDKKFESTDEELKHVHSHVESSCESISRLINYTRFSKWERLLRCTAYVKRYVQKLKIKRNNTLKLGQKSISEMIHSAEALTANELNEAELCLFKIIQSESYGVEIRTLQCGERSISRRSALYNFNPVIDSSGMLKLSSRIDVAPAIDSESIRKPIILSREHYITNLLIDAIHRKFQHVNKENVVNHLRQYVWIPKVRMQVGRVVRSCPDCVRRSAKPRVPRMAALPEGRLSPFQPAFSFTGLDFFGPIEITIGRHHEKRWGVIFVCLSMRAIHLELAASLDTDAAIMCVRNFVNRRGPPVEMISDNGTNLRAAEKELRKAIEEIDFQRLQAESISYVPNETRTSWKFIPPSAPHYGGSWERMIQTVKKSLYIILKDKYPHEDTLRSALIEVENLVNSRPLYYSSNEIDNEEAITPNHLIKGTGRQVVQFEGEFDCKKQWRQSQALATEFWRRWLHEYLPTISTRPKWRDEVESIAVGQLVMMVDGCIPKGEWRRGVVTNVFPSPDGRIRKVEIRTSNSTYIRPVAKLALLNIGAAL